MSRTNMLIAAPPFMANAGFRKTSLPAPIFCTSSYEGRWVNEDTRVLRRERRGGRIAQRRVRPLVVVIVL